ncbi:D-amino-acid dehydrogenase [Rhodococcus sp. 27YEA15]|uniref:NAD(P)/FAD-dependent oxidoreductase n=1 Tax=Rhodococcus sp. 27YEA15 TaxID=3156259 RepID=UPI003C7ABCE4
MVQHNSADIVVIGAGVIGATIANEAAREGLSVIVIDAGSDVGAGCSYANAGLLSPDHVEPLATIKNVRDGLRFMWRPDSPFLLRPRLRLAPWLARFVAAAYPRRAKAASVLLKSMAATSLEMHAEYGKNGESTSFTRSGSLDIFETEQALALYRARGAETLSPAQTRELVPQVSGAVGAIRRPDDATVDSRVYVRDMLDRATEGGAEVRWNTRVVGVRTDAGRVVEIYTSSGNLTAGTFVLAAGLASRTIGKMAGLDLPIEGAKGYVLDQAVDGESLSMPITFKERRVVATPYSDRLRLCGTLELGADDLQLNAKRLGAVQQAGIDALAAVKIDHEVERWAGFRPCTPDGMPIIGRSSKIRNVVTATGHGMWGVILAPVTARMVLDEVRGKADLDRSLSPNRFLGPLARRKLRTQKLTVAVGNR